MAGALLDECNSTETIFNYSNPAVLDVFGIPTGTPDRNNVGTMNVRMPLIAEFNQGPCDPSPTVLCLNEGRFKVEVEWRTQTGTTGVGSVAGEGTDDSGIFYFFNPLNWEMLVKVLDNCSGSTNRFWVFAAATTNVEYTLRVPDTETQAVREYFNPLGVSSAAITDTNAFATCP